MKRMISLLLPGRRLICVCMSVMLVLTLAACGSKVPLQAPTEITPSTVSIETAYGALEFPEELYPDLRHVEVVEGSVAMEIFYMLYAGGEREVYRIYYADPQSGTLAGYLQTDDGDISVSFSLCEYTDEIFPKDEERQLYYSMMDAFSVIMNSIVADERFSETRHQEAAATRDVALRYWTVTLPENILYTESEESGNYRVDFYAELSGERVELYMIGLGDLEGDTTLGMYTVGDTQRPVVIKTYDQSAYDDWPQEGKIALHQMMDTLNDVIQAITENENFA